MGATLVGSPELAIKGIERLLELSGGGFGGVLFRAHEWATREETLRSYELFARYVMPRFQGSIATTATRTSGAATTGRPSSGRTSRPSARRSPMPVRKCRRSSSRSGRRARATWGRPSRAGRDRGAPRILRGGGLMPIIRTACAHDCPDQCSLLAHVEDGRLTKLQGDPNVMTAGFVCTKVNREHEALYSPDRIATPLRRAGAKGAGRFVPISWPEALDEIVGRWQAIIREDGPLALLGYAYSAHQGQLNRGLLLGLFHALGVTRLLAGTVCDSCAEAGWDAACGSVGGADPETVVHSDL